MTLQEITPMIEGSLVGLKLDPAACRGQKPGQWSCKVKDATIWIDVFSMEVNQGKWYFQVMSPLCKVPNRKAAEFMQDMLEMNHNTYGSWMTKKGEWFYVMCLRETHNLDQSEIDATMDRVAFYSTDYYSKLSFKYQGCWDPTPPVNVSGGRAE
jgi:hypothetical protein